MIIVDLDDTLIDTRRTLRREKLRDCAALSPDPEAVGSFLLERASGRVPGRAIIAECCAAFGFDDDLRDAMLAEYYEHHPENPKVPLLPGAREALEELSQDDEIVCVTAGTDEQQRAKIANAGLDDVFTRVIVTADSKAEAYATLLGSADPASFIVIGDKLSDLIPARELGMRAILYGPSDEWDGESSDDWSAIVGLLGSAR